MINKNRLGLTLGLFAGLLHLIWAVSVAVGIAESWLEWILPLHFISLVVPVAGFDVLSAVILTITAFIGGYICGWLLAWVWNKLGK